MLDETRAGELVRKAKAGTLTLLEAEQVIASLKLGHGGVDTYHLLYIVGRSFQAHEEELVASYLECSEDPMLARLALQILCDQWNKTEKYLNEVRRFAAGVVWDSQDDVRQVAISIAGEYLRAHDEAQLFELLLSISEGPADEYSALPGFAVEALARALGDEWEGIPGVGERSRETRWQQQVIDRAYEEYFSRYAP
jgi:hypothetical protein